MRCNREGGHLINRELVTHVARIEPALMCRVSVTAAARRTAGVYVVDLPREQSQHVLAWRSGHRENMLNGVG